MEQEAARRLRRRFVVPMLSSHSSAGWTVLDRLLSWNLPEQRGSARFMGSLRAPTSLVCADFKDRLRATHVADSERLQ
jgi:hypothetical protein